MFGCEFGNYFEEIDDWDGHVVSFYNFVPRNFLPLVRRFELVLGKSVCEPGKFGQVYCSSAALPGCRSSGWCGAWFGPGCAGSCR